MKPANRVFSFGPDSEPMLAFLFFQGGIFLRMTPSLPDDSLGIMGYSGQEIAIWVFPSFLLQMTDMAVA